MRRLIMLMVIMMAVFALSAAEVGGESAEKDTAELEIKGYKIAKNPENKAPTLTITDAITGSLNVVNDSDKIEISEHVGTLLGNASEGTSVFNEQVIFSYRIVGYTAGSFGIDMKFGPIARVNDQESDKEDYIAASYELRNLSYSFPEYSSNIVSDESSINFNDSIQGIDSGISKKPVLVKAEKNSIGTLSASFTVTDNENEGVPRWIQRGAVAMTIDRTSYNNAAIGNYAATVEVILKSI